METTITPNIDLSRHTRRCGFCGQKLMAPCDNPMQAETCRKSRNLAGVYAIANTVGHPARRRYSLLISQYHFSNDFDKLVLDLKMLEN